MADALTIGLYGLVLVLIALLLYALGLLKTIQTQNAVQKEAIDNIDTEIKPEVITAGIAGSGEVLKGAMADSLGALGIGKDIGEIKSSASAMALVVQEIQNIFLDKQAAAGWAEIELERTLKDSFSDVHIRKKVPKLDSIPDAHLTLGDRRILCIDSKFPIKAFKDVIALSEGGEGEEDGRARRGNRKVFLDAVKGHISKVETSYVRPDLGTTEIAYLYIASERIYLHMIDPDNTDESELIRDAASRGVIVCSPSTLIANMHLLYIAERAMGIAEKSDEILKGHDRLRKELNSLVSTWGKLSTQISNSYSNRNKLQEAIEDLDRVLRSLESLNLGDDE